MSVAPDAAQSGPATGAFTTVTDLTDRRYRENWAQLYAILAKRKSAVTHHELLEDWPIDSDRPPVCQLSEWLNRAYEERRIRREGQGRRNDPYRYRLENEDDRYYDRGELPPLRPLEFVPPP